MRGVVDFARADVRDVDWWRRCNVLIGEMEREDDREITKALLALHCAYLANGSLKDDSFQQQSEQAKQQLMALFDAMRPWAATAASPEALLKTITDKYRAQVGDPNDPAFMAKIADGVRRHKALQRQAQSETEEQRIARLIRERALRRSQRPPRR